MPINYINGMRITDIEAAIYFLQRVVPRGDNETDELLATVYALQQEINRRRKQPTT
jgi:hypothetical protein